MRFAPQILDEIKSRLPVSRVVERKVKLRRAGREYMGLSPFKSERTPSFTVNDQKGFYHCFSSGEHGDIFSFVMKTEGLTFAEAIERLAAEAGVVLPQPDRQTQATEDKRERLLTVSNEACTFFERMLRTAAGEAAIAYLTGRGVGPDEIARFRIGFAPDNRTALKIHLAAQNYTDAEMQEAGLLIHGEDIAVPYDRFRGRLMFPIMDRKGRVIAFGGRALKPDQQPKYLNSPETPLFHKGHVLFNLAAAKEAVRERGQIIVAEGYMDVIALTRAGFPNAVAPLGTALTEDQLRLLWSMAPSPTLCFDGDTAGKKAASRALDMAMAHLEPERTLQFAFLPDGQDPDDMLRLQGRDALAECLKSALPMVDVLWRREEATSPRVTPEQRAGFEARLMEHVGKIAHSGLRFQYVNAIRQRLRAEQLPLRRLRPTANADGDWRLRIDGASPPRYRDKYNSAPKAGQASLTTSLLHSAAVRGASSSQAREALIVRSLVSHPWLMKQFAEDVAALVFGNARCRAIRDSLLAHFETLGATLITDEASSHADNEQMLDDIKHLLTHTADKTFHHDADKHDVTQAFRHIVALHNAIPMEEALREAESDYNIDQSPENFARLCALRQQTQVAVL